MAAVRWAFLFLRGAALATVVLSANRSAAAPPVTISENAESYTLANGLLTARISKRSGDLLSLRYKNLELLDTVDQPQAGYWSHNVARAGPIIARVTIDPRQNGGARGEVSLKGISGGEPLGHGPGGSVVADIEIRYTLARGDSALYTYSIFSHPTNYPATSVGEARFCLKLNDDLFDWMTVDSNRNMEMITAYDWDHGTQMNLKEARRMNTGLYRGQVEHKYDYAANQFAVRAWGWSSTKHNVGVWFINPSVEYLSGGPTKFELTAHRDATFDTNALDAPAPPCLLNYWRSSHYGGAICNIAATDNWTKVIGPFLIYCNSAKGHEAMWRDALVRAAKEEKAWPYDWVQGVDYPHKSQRATVRGQLFLEDPQMPGFRFTNLLVGLTAPDYTPPLVRPNFRDFGRRRFGGNFTNRFGTNFFARFWRFAPRAVTWQNDAKDYEFWVRADANGRFQIPNVRPGHYTLHAIADGVLGEFALSNVTVAAGEKLSLGKLTWRPVRYGRQLWDIGIPNRTASEFFKGNDYFHWGWYLKYAELFPHDVHYVIGQSDFCRDWFFEQVPHNENPNDTNGAGEGRATPWTISFNLTNAPRGRAILRLAICGVGARELDVTVNGRSVGAITNLFPNETIDRDGIGGSWGEHDLTFDASLMKAGENELQLIVPAGRLVSGLMYDYLRLELEDPAAATAKANSPAPAPARLEMAVDKWRTSH
jgi:rhamnogalacturonan endolyase